MCVTAVASGRRRARSNRHGGDQLAVRATCRSAGHRARTGRRLCIGVSKLSLPVPSARNETSGGPPAKTIPDCSARSTATAARPSVAAALRTTGEASTTVSCSSRSSSARTNARSRSAIPKVTVRSSLGATGHRNESRQPVSRSEEARSKGVRVFCTDENEMLLTTTVWCPRIGPRSSPSRSACRGQCCAPHAGPTRPAGVWVQGHGRAG